MNSDINWLTLVLAVILLVRMDLVVTDRACSDDYWPCTCKITYTSTGDSQRHISCNQIRNVEIVQAVFKRTPPADVHSFYMTIPETESFEIPEYFFFTKIVRNIHLTCQTNQIPYLILHRDAFYSSRLFLEHLHIENCDMSKQTHQWSVLFNFHFVKSLTFSRTKNLGTDFPPLISLTTLNMTHSFDFERLLHGPICERKFPNLVNLVVNYCPNITAKVACFQGLEILIMNSNQIGDLETEKMTKLRSDSKTLRLFSLMDNGLTRLPNINKFTNLTHLRLDNNNLTSENFSLALLNGKRLQTLTLSSCNLKNIKPGSLDVNNDHFQLKLLNLDNNQLTRFESSVFQDILQKMANRWEDPGMIHVYRNSFDCNCHLAWLIVDNRHLLRHVRGARCSDGLAFKKLKSSQFAACNGISGQLKPRPLS